VQAHPHPGGLRDQLNPEPNKPTLKSGWTQDRGLATTSRAKSVTGQEAGYIDAGWHPGQLLIMLTDIARSIARPKDTAVKLLDTRRQGTSLAVRRADAVEAARRLAAPTT
jgi:hypothetical protein